MVFAGLTNKVVELMRATGLLAVIVIRRSHSRLHRILVPVNSTFVAEGIKDTSCLLPQR